MDARFDNKRCELLRATQKNQYKNANGKVKSGVIKLIKSYL